MDKAVKIMKGKPKTEVSITVLRKDKEGKNEYIDMNIMREEIRLITVKSSLIDEDIGYIRITSFDELTYKDFAKEMDSLMKKIYLDL